MNEAEFIIRRIVKAAKSWVDSEYQRKLDSNIRPLVVELHRDGQQALIKHLIETFIERKEDESGKN